MKLSVSAFRAQASAQRKILSSHKNHLNYGACTSFPALGGFAVEEKAQMMVDSTAITPIGAAKPHQQPPCEDPASQAPQKQPDTTKIDKQDTPDPLSLPQKREHSMPLDRSPARTRSKSNQRWMKLRTTVQLSGAISSTNQKSKAPLKREDSFLKRFSTRQIPETQETVDTGDETETHSGSQTQNEVNRRRRKRRKEMSKTVVNPDENFYFYWLMTVTVCVLYNLWTLIVRQSFPELQKAASAFWYSGDGFTDIVFACDIMVQFRTGYLEQGLMVYNSRKLASHYLKSRAFIFDTLSLLPLDFLQLNIGVNPLLRFPRFLKVYRVYSYYYMVESRTVYPNLWRVVNLIHILLILAHWFGCFYYLLSEAEGFQGDWVYPHRPGDYATLTRKYLGSLYWSTLTLTTIGDLPTPETNAESRGRSKAMTSSGQSEGIPRRGHKSRLLQFNSNYGYLFTIVSYLIGVFIFATIVGQVGNVITNRNANRLEFERLLDGAKTYMRHHKVPGGMKRRVLRWYDYSWSRGRIQGGGDINTALGLLPDKLKTELALHVNLSVLKKVTIFQECQPEFLHDLVLKMKAYIFTPGDLICRKGEVAREMFIIADGILDVISETGRVLTTMKAGDFFGEIGILNLDGLNKRTADVRSVGYSELFSLSREDVLTAMKDYPEAQEILQSLGRRRLMEAKNASKMQKTQARQAKDHDSSGDSDTAGKRIVDKLRSDVKGLKKALRRSRRGTGTKGSTDGAAQMSGEKARAKKQSILRRMSHVQSSDECEATADFDQTPIGAGLPLLQRLKMLKEKQEREGEEKENVRKVSAADGSSSTRGESSRAETVGIGVPFSQKLKLLRQKEVKESVASGFGVVQSTVRTQVTGSQLSGSSGKTKTFSSPRDAAETSDERTIEVKSVGEPKGKLGISLKEKLKLSHGGQAKENNFQEEEGVSFEGHRKTFVNVPTAREADNSVPKLVRNILELPVGKDGWKLLKKSSISCPKSGGEDEAARKASKKSTYLSKSDTVLERQKTVERDEEKRSRSISPSNGGPSQRRAPVDSAGGRRRSRSVGHSPKLGGHKDDIARWHFLNSSTSGTKKICSEHHEEKNEETRKKMKKYNSISDLSPEYSGLPFVKKLKILNERQKLEELEKELVVRSISLDVSERPTRGPVLVRSQSEAGTAEYTNIGLPNLREELASAFSPVGTGTRLKEQQHSECRYLTGDDKRCESWISRCSEGSIASPESNETLERRHLKSILKKLSAEGSTSDEDKIFRSLDRGGSSSSKKDDNTEFRKLMREPTLEGYVARHKKLTKSVTFDSDTLPSPLDVVLEQPQDEPKAKGYSPMSPTAILTLQLSNLSMMPIASPKKVNKSEKEPEEGEENGCRASGAEVQIKAGGATPKMGPKSGPDDLPKVQNNQKHNLLISSPAHELIERKLATLSFTANLHDQFFNEVEGEILEIVRQLLEKAHNKFESGFKSLQAEVQRRDEIIAHLQSKIQELETKYPKKLQSKGGGEVAGKNAEGSATESDFSDVPFQREDSCETVWDGRSGFDVCVSRAESPEEEDNSWTATENGVVTMSQPRDSPPDDDDLSDFDYLANVVDSRETRNSWEGVCDAKDKVHLMLTHGESGGFVKGGVGVGVGTCSETSSAEELELMQWAGPFRVRDVRRKRNGSPEESYEESFRKAEKGGKGSKGSFIDRVSKFQRSISGCQEKNAGFVALDIDESSNSSDVENCDNKDWEVQMLVEELAKKDPYWKVQKEKWGSHAEGDVEDLEDVKKLREEVNTLKRVVCDGDLSRLTSSELDILESIIDAKDEKILEIAKSSSVDDDSKNDAEKSAVLTFHTSRAQDKANNGEQSKKCSLKQKIGQALSFDFHDMDTRKPKVLKSIRAHGRSCLKTQKTISGSHREHQSLYNLWRTSTRLRNRVLDDSEKIIQNLPVTSSTSAGSRSSLPILISTSPNQDKSSNLRASLPVLSAKDFTSSASSFEELHHQRHANRALDTAYQEMETSVQVEPPNSTSATAKSTDGHAASSFNSFIKSVGQKVKQVMVGDVNAVRNQVPTISKLLEDHSSLKSPETGASEVDGVASQEDVRPIASESSKLLSSFDHDPKTDPPDL